MGQSNKKRVLRVEQRLLYISLHVVKSNCQCDWKQLEHLHSTVFVLEILGQILLYNHLQSLWVWHFKIAAKSLNE